MACGFPYCTHACPPCPACLAAKCPVCLLVYNTGPWPQSDGRQIYRHADGYCVAGKRGT